MGKKNTNFMYTDGGTVRSAVVIVESGEIVSEVVEMYDAPLSNDKTESSPILSACFIAQVKGGNWTIVTDSKSILNKINNNCANATKNSDISAIQHVIKRVNESPTPSSINIKWERRNSNEFMKRADYLASHGHNERL